MNNEPKILLTIQLEGVLSQKKEEVEIAYAKSSKNNANLILERGTVKHMQPIATVANQHLKMNMDAYHHFIENTMPEWYKYKLNGGRHWHSLSPNEKIKQHCSRIADGRPFTFIVL